MVSDAVKARSQAQGHLIAADTLRAADQVADAVTELERALLLEEALEPNLLAEIRLRLADCYRELNRHEKSYEAIGPLLDNPPDAVWRARSLVRFARTLYFRGDIEATEAACEEARAILRRTSHHHDLALALLWRGHALRARGRMEEAEESLRDGMAAARRVDAHDLEAACLNTLGHLFMTQGRLAEADTMIRSALEVHDQAGNRPDVAKAVLHLAFCRFRRGIWSESEALLDRANETYAGLHDSRGLALTEIFRARLARVLGQDPTANLDRAEVLAKKSGFFRAQHQVLEERGFAALDRSDHETAIAMFRQILTAGGGESAGKDVQYDARRGLALAYGRSGRTEEARPIARAALEESAEAGDRLAAALARLALGEIEHDRAQAERALREIRAIGAPAELEESRRVIAGLGGVDGAGSHGAVTSCLELAVDAPAETPTPVAAPVFVAKSGAARRLRDRAQALGRFEGSILLEGEASVGKSRLAALIHSASPRARHDLVVVHCAGVEDEALLCELFGHWPTQRPGVLRQVGEGTVLLRDVSALSLAVQTRLERALETGRGLAVGAVEDYPLRARVIASTTRGLGELVTAGDFLPGLYNQLAGMVLAVPPLRDRAEDVEALAEHFLQEPIAPEVADTLRSHTWPGNVAELQKVLEGARFRAKAAAITRADLPESLTSTAPAGRPTLPDMIRELEERQIVATLESTGGNKKAAAARLGVSRKGLIDRLKRLGLWERFGRHSG